MKNISKISELCVPESGNFSNGKLKMENGKLGQSEDLALFAKGKMKKTPFRGRKCCGCQAIKNRDEMIKITAEHDTGKIVINPDSKTFGRSVYLCPEKACLERALKRSSVTKLLKNKYSKCSENAPEKIKTELENIIVK